MAPVSRRGLLQLGLGLGTAVYVGADLVQDLGVTRGEGNEYAPMYDGLSGVGTKYEVATFAGGCFWCMEQPFDDMDGVVATVSGYTGGYVERPSYMEVSSGRTGHAESVQVVFDPSRVSYEALLDTFFHNIDPTTVDRQFVDAGSQYRSAIFYSSDEQRAAAEAAIARLDAGSVFGAKIVTQVAPLGEFYTAEKYHQDYYKTHAQRYGVYRSFSGRDEYIQKVWGVDYWMQHHH